jgi:D-alanyl-D-alanine endopeptidase (penicillin-binding protein 7)
MRGIVLAALLLLSSAHATTITAQSWIQTDKYGNLIEGSNITEVRSIASITKLMTAIAVLDNNQNLDEKIGLYTRGQLIQLTLVRSNNNAAELLCSNFPGGRFQCIRYMNDKAKYLGMVNTKFVDPTGLSPMNISTAVDLLKLVQASSKYVEIVKASQTQTLKLKVGKRSQFFNNTNPIINRHHFVVSKTGTTRAAGGCIVMMLDTALGRRIVILLGSREGRRIPEAEFIALQG